MTLRDFLEREQNAAVERRPTAADGDWAPTATIESYDGQTTVLVLDPAFMATADRKNTLAELLGQSVLRARGIRVAFTNPMWATVDRGEPGQPLPANDPARSEWLTITAADVDETLFAFATVTRRAGERPLLGSWELAGEAVEGRFVDAVRIALHWERSLAEDPMRFLRELQARTPELHPARRLLDEVVALGESDAELIESMPIRKWWLERSVS